MGEILTTHPVIENWSVVSDGDLYLPPESQSKRIAGKVYGHPNFIDGTRVVTSSVINSEGRFVDTNSRRYFLGLVDESYQQWVNKNCGRSFDPVNPVKIVVQSQTVSKNN